VQQTRETYAVRFEEGSRPCALRAEPIDSPGGQAGWMIFEPDGAALRLGFHDGLGRRPAGFDARPGMVVLRLERRTAR
jgi:hypothetical protein